MTIECPVHGSFSEDDTGIKECPECLQAERDRYREALGVIASFAKYPDPIGCAMQAYATAVVALNP